MPEYIYKCEACGERLTRIYRFTCIYVVHHKKNGEPCEGKLEADPHDQYKPKDYLLDNTKEE